MANRHFPHPSAPFEPADAVSTCLRVSIALTCLGAALISLRYEGPVFTWLFIGGGWPEEDALRVEHGAAWAFLGSIPLLFLRNGRPALVFLAVWTGLRAAAQSWDEVWHPELVPLDLAARALAPLGLLAICGNRRTLGTAILRVAVAATFLGHGLEALYGKPEFVDLLLAAGRKLLGLSIPESGARETLRAIGSLDLLVAASLLLPVRWRGIAAWAAFWGLLTAAARIVHLGWQNTPEALVRAVHAGAPLALFFAWRPVESGRSLMEPKAPRRMAASPAAFVAFLLAFAPLALGQQGKGTARIPAGTTPAHGRVVWTERPDTQATVSWSTGQGGSSHRVYYDVQPRRGQLASYAWQAEAAKNGRFTGGAPELYYHHAPLSGLKAGTTYHFVMVSDAAVSPEYHFVTAPSDDAPFRLIVGGDSRSDAAARRKMNALLAQALEKDKGILALCHGGDFMRTGTSLPDWAEWMGDHELTTAAGRMLPVLPVRGNHEKSGVQFDEVWNWPGGGLGKNYSATTIGSDLLLVTLNSNISTEGDQAKFLEKTLRENAKVRWQLAQYHRPAYPAVKSPGGGKEAWVPIFEKYNLDLACESDGHTIKRTVPIRNDKYDPTGVVYIGEGGLGVGQRTPDNDLWYLQPPGMCGKGHHYFLLSVEKEALRTKILLMDGSVFDESEIKPRRR
jgi:purple acid phosphatase-like protein/calcineurin-like phosphoesterase family protein